LVGKWEYPNKEWFLQYTASSISFYLSTDGLNDSATFTVSTTVPLNAWNHIAVTRSSSNLYIFLNGTLVSTQSITQTFYAATQVVSIGNFPFGGISDTGMRGYVSDVRLVKGTALYTSSFTPPTAPLTAVSNTQLLTNFTNAGIPDLAMINNLETVGNAQVSTSVKKYGTGSLYFDGNGDYLTSPSSVANGIGSGDFTFECWIYQLGSGDGQSVWDCRTTGTQAAPCFIIQQSTNLPRFVVNGADTITATTPIPVNTWTHFAICRSGTSLRMFVNGTQTGSTYTDTTTYVSSMPMNLGTYVPSPANNYYVGYLDDVRFTKGYARYTANFTPPTAAFSTS
jgi:hypothetical protein